MFQGSIIALVTPMHKDGSLALSDFKALIEWHIKAKTDALVIAGTTGESATLEASERFELLALAVKTANGRIPIIAGSGTNATKTTLIAMKEAEQAGVNAHLIITPYYNKPTQGGLYQHYKTVAEHSALPIILYNVPSRTGCDLLAQTIIQLSKIDIIIGVKEATGNLHRATEIIQGCHQGFSVYSGDDHSALALMLYGAKGVISVTGNVVPEKLHQLIHAIQSNDFKTAIAINKKIANLHQQLFIESNPIPVKWALHRLGKIPSGIRLPLTPLNSQYHSIIDDALSQAGVLS